jgi:hypothetical protein
VTDGFGGPPVSGLPPGGVVHVGRRCHTLTAVAGRRAAPRDQPGATREILAAFLNDLNDECLARWGPRGDNGQAAGLPEPPAER